MAKDKQVTHDRIVYRCPSGWIERLATGEHWRLYRRQQKIMEGRIDIGDSILEIGVGTGFTANYLKSKGFVVTTVDIDEEKKPSIVANLVTFQPDQLFDHVLAFEVFEHIPFEKIVKVTENLAGKCSKYLFMSVPRYLRTIASIESQLPRLGKVAFARLSRNAG